MRLLFELDKMDYSECTRSYIRNSARSILIRDGRIAMIHSRKYDYYKFPGGGIEPEETALEALIRETREEAGLQVIPESIREYGYVHRIQRSTYDEAEYFIQDNFYYLCTAEDTPVAQKLDDYESEERFTLVYITPEEAIRSNRTKPHGPKDPVMIEREARVLELLISEGCFQPDWTIPGSDPVPAFEIRPAETDEEKRGKAYVHWKAWHEAYPGLIRQDYLDRITLEQCEKIAFTWTDNLLVAKDHGRVIGFVGYGTRDERHPEIGEVFALYVLSDYYGTGAARQLMAAALEQLSGRDRICLWTLKENRRAIRFYEKCGFFPDGESKANPNLNAEEIRMTLRKEKTGSSSEISRV